VPIEVLIVCRAELLMLGLERLLSQAEDMKVYTYASVPTFVRTSGSRRQPGSGFRVQTPIRVALVSDRENPEVAAITEEILGSVADEVVLLSSRPDMDVLVGCMGAGARGFVMEGDHQEVLMGAVRAAADRRTYMGQRTLDLLVEWLAGQERLAVQGGRSGADVDLLRLLAEGRSTDDIASSLGIAPKTVRNRLTKLYRRLGVHSRSAAVRLAEERGMLDPGDRGRRS
jgi:DNA-binding NarL/FixJ family response regulator